jgi:DNA-binding transcriptional regulator LsrR (DeoR family)
LCSNIEKRVIALGAEDLKGVPRVIGIATGEKKAKSILGALRSGILDVLITDEKTARLVMRLSIEN